MSCPPVKLSSDILFYHSFHRHWERDTDRSISIGILRSIFKRGLLMGAEEQPLAATGALPPTTIVQKRICFNAIEPKEIRAHQAVFGDFTLEFDSKIVREFGAQPAFYLAGNLAGGTLFNDSGRGFARQIFEAHELLGRLWQLKDAGDPDVQAALGKTYAYPNHLIQTIYFSLQALVNLYYPTDLESVEPLQFFRQREWKIVPNLAAGGVWHYPPLDPQSRAELVALAPKHFETLVLGTPRIDHCSLYSPIEGRHLVQEARRIIVPDHLVSEVADMAASAGLTLRVDAVSSLPS